MTAHDASCRCAECRHARFKPGPSSSSRRARRSINFYGHFTYRPRSQSRGGAPRISLFGMSYQTAGPIMFGPPDFVASAQSRNKYLSAPALTIRWVA